MAPALGQSSGSGLNEAHVFWVSLGLQRCCSISLLRPPPVNGIICDITQNTVHMSLRSVLRAQTADCWMPSSVKARGCRRALFICAICSHHRRCRRGTRAGSPATGRTEPAARSLHVNPKRGLPDAAPAGIGEHKRVSTDQEPLSGLKILLVERIIAMNGKCHPAPPGRRRDNGSERRRRHGNPDRAVFRLRAFRCQSRRRDQLGDRQPAGCRRHALRLCDGLWRGHSAGEQPFGCAGLTEALYSRRHTDLLAQVPLRKKG